MGKGAEGAVPTATRRSLIPRQPNRSPPILADRWARRACRAPLPTLRTKGMLSGAKTNRSKNKLRSFPRKREPSSLQHALNLQPLGPRFRGDERKFWVFADERVTQRSVRLVPVA